MVNSDELKYNNVIDSLLFGDFYASTGPEIFEISVKDFKVKIKCSDAKQISLTTIGRRSKSIIASDNTFINEAEFNVFEADVYFRISVIDKNGKRADSQSYFLEDFI